MLTLTNVTWLNLCLVGVGVYLVKQIFTKKNPAPYPPGPPGWPLVGNISDMPQVKPWLTFAEWGKKYGKCLLSCQNLAFQLRATGDISHIELMGQHIIVVNSLKTTLEMLDKKSSVYSDRPLLPMVGELCGWKHSLPLVPYGDRFRWHRKNFHHFIGNGAALHPYHPIEEIETHRFLKRVLANPDQLPAHIRQYVLLIPLLTRS